MQDAVRCASSSASAIAAPMRRTLVDRERAACETRLERAARHELHDEEVDSHPGHRSRRSWRRPGCDRRARARVLRAETARASVGSRERAGQEQLDRDVAVQVASCAFQTSPIPPSPIGARSR